LASFADRCSHFSGTPTQAALAPPSASLNSAYTGANLTDRLRVSPRTPAPPPPADPIDASLRRELYLFALYRVMEAGIFVFFSFSPLAGIVSELSRPGLARLASGTYLLVALLLWLATRVRHWPLRHQAAIGLGTDIVASVLAIQSLAGVGTGISLLLVFNIAAAALFLSLRGSMLLALLAALAVSLPQMVTAITEQTGGTAMQAVMVTVTYLATAVLTYLLGSDMRASHQLAKRRGEDLANLAQINELIIHRMRAGVLVVDETNHVQVINEAAWYLLGKPPPERKSLSEIAPELSRRLWHWRNRKAFKNVAVALAEDAPEVLPRFTRLSTSEGLALIFLQDTSMVSRRAEELTLSTLGRLSASIAHEIRNPLAAISYSAQLLEESPLSDTDRRMVEIINTQCHRMNSIIQDILGMARRERAQPEPVELVSWARRFIAEFRATRSQGDEQLQVSTRLAQLDAMVDPGHLHQVITALVNNAINYGRLPNEPPRITLTVRQFGDLAVPAIEVIDRGPGIVPKVVASIFEPFFTTSESGTGLGLYIARQLCEANQASLEYESVAGGGSCFRIVLPAAGALSEPAREPASHS
jgi:two-component system sensor histidine kinase PilS (NtrC family)